jgi:hypothetical protein
VADVNTIASYIYGRAKQMGVNPNLALGIARFEGLNPNTIGSETFGNKDASGYSFGPYQLFSGSPDPSRIAPGGMAYEFQQRFGSAPSRENWQQQVDFALERMKNKGTGAWYAVRDQGGVDAITQKGEQFARQVGLGGDGQPSPISPTPISGAATPPTAAPSGPVYSRDLGTSFQRLGNFLAPDWVEAPKALTEEQAAQQQIQARKDAAEMGQIGDAAKAFAAMQAMAARQEALANQPMSLLQPMVTRGQFRPISPMRGLL